MKFNLPPTIDPNLCVRVCVCFVVFFQPGWHRVDHQSVNITWYELYCGFCTAVPKSPFDRVGEKKHQRGDQKYETETVRYSKPQNKHPESEIKWNLMLQKLTPIDYIVQYKRKRQVRK